MMSRIRFTFLISLVALTSTLIAVPATAHDQVPGRSQTRPILLRDGIIHRVDAPTLPRGSVLLVDGKIESVAAKINAPENAEIIDVSGRHVYPGLIDAMTDLGLSEISAVDVTVDRTELGRDNPNVRSWVAVNPDSELIPVSRAGGVLTAHVAPGGSFLRGQSSVLNLDGWSVRDMNVLSPAMMCVDWETIAVRGDLDADLIKKRESELDKLDEWLDRAERYQAAKQSAIESGTSDLFAVDVRLESLLPVLRGELPIMAEANRRAAIESAIAYAQTRSLRMVIYGGYDAVECADLLRAADIPVILDGIYRLPLRRSDPYDHAYTLPARLQAAKVRFAIAGEGPGYPGGASNTRNLPYHAGCAVAYGLDPNVAIASITLSVAEILGVADSIGSITAGKDATVIVVDGDVLESTTNVTHAWIRGKRVDLGNRHETLFQKYRQKYR